MSYKPAQNEIFRLIEAGYPAIYVVTEEEKPVVKTLTKIAAEFLTEYKYNVFTWNYPMGIFCEHGDNITKGHGKNGEMLKRDENSLKPLSERIDNLFDFIVGYEGNAMFVLHDFDYIFREFKESSLGLKEVIDQITIPIKVERMLKRYLLSTGKKYHKHIIITSSTQLIPNELDKKLNVVSFGLPGREEISEIIQDVLNTSEGTNKLSEEEFEEVIQGGRGLTETELINALFKSIVMNDGKINSKDVTTLKEQIIKKGGMLEYISKVVGVNEVGSLKQLISWIKLRKVLFNDKVREKRNLSYPKGFFLTGVQGCGKSLAAIASGSILGLPVIKYDIGKTKGMYYGQSEENLQKVFRMARAVSPCILWIDEIDKAFPDPRSSNTHEVSKALLGEFLNFLQENTDPIFVVATANNIDLLPPELMRKGRFDEIFFVDLPNSVEEREEILKIHLEKRKIPYGHINVKKIAELTDGFIGAELEAIVEEANVYSAAQDEELTQKHLEERVEETVPLSVMQKDKIEAIRKWAEIHRIRRAN